MLDYLKKLITKNILFSLERIISPKLVNILYLLGLFSIILWAISHLFATFTFGFGAGLWGLVEVAVFSLLAFVVLRIICEAIIVFFKANEEIAEAATPLRVPVSLIDEVREAIEELAEDEPTYKIPEEAPKPAQTKAKTTRRRASAKRTPSTKSKTNTK